MWRYYYWQWRDSVENYKKIDISTFKKWWMLGEWIGYKKWTFSWSRSWEKNWNIWVEINKWSTSGYIRVFFTQTSYDWEKKSFDYKISLVSTPCNYWGVRWWFLCPCKENRCSILYLQGNWIFASRKTLNLCYSEQKESKRYRYLWYLMWDAFTKIELIRRTMKYPVRNWRYTRKARRIIKLQEKMPSMEEVEGFRLF